MQIKSAGAMTGLCSRRILRLRLQYSRYWFMLVPTVALILFIFSVGGGFSFPCTLMTCHSEESLPSPDQKRNGELSSLSDLNGIEICLSIKFVEPIQPLELTGSPQLGTKGPYVVVYNYLKSSKFYAINETVTFTTHSTPEFMNNVGTIAERWDGPVSVALFVPSTDFCRTLHRLIFLRNCDKAAYREKVTWHLYWPKDSPPPSSWSLVPDETQVECEKLANDYRHNIDLKQTWRAVNHLSYPINVGRNVARQASTTWFVLPSDVELFPSIGLAPQFMNFISHQSNNLKMPPRLNKDPPRRVYVVPVFEVKEILPNKKEELIIQLARNSAVYFHRLVCPHCQRFPGIRKWITEIGTPGQIHAMSWTQRVPPYHRWEPIFVCSPREPLYDELLSWDGLQDKMTQMHELCLLGYEFVILDRAFLVHAPGIKRPTRRSSRNSERDAFVKENARIYEQVVTMLDTKYGANTKCPHH
ncbi:hypothetical protein HAZT_HAZT001330 [Hyalella azteca]|uniref:N-acetyllactosaminide beta-1,3-N-acetylglucosaminyltransferase n=2 Tax=Hyalella azteca TaxID=294128 RepID=A0A6A0GTZ3_HYAAZ|nr:hypothetical protein HAZT_HAZT001330 [Hyalella azteca]